MTCGRASFCSCSQWLPQHNVWIICHLYLKTGDGRWREGRKIETKGRERERERLGRSFTSYLPQDLLVITHLSLSLSSILPRFPRSDSDSASTQNQATIDNCSSKNTGPSYLLLPGLCLLSPSFHSLYEFANV